MNPTYQSPKYRFPVNKFQCHSNSAGSSSSEGGLATRKSDGLTSPVCSSHGGPLKTNQDAGCATPRQDDMASVNEWHGGTDTSRSATYAPTTATPTIKERQRRIAEVKQAREKAQRHLDTLKSKNEDRLKKVGAECSKGCLRRCKALVHFIVSRSGEIPAQRTLHRCFWRTLYQTWHVCFSFSADQRLSKFHCYNKFAPER